MDRRIARSGLLVAALLAAPVGVSGQDAEPAAVVAPAGVASLHGARLLNRVEEHVDGALLAASDDERDRWLEAAEQVARHLVAADPASADAHYWLAVTLGIRTEFGGPVEKLTTGKEVFFTAARVLELDPDHAGGHEMMGRLHAAVMRLPWLIRGLAMRMGMGDALGEASWEQAEAHFLRACDLDPRAIAPRLELAKLYVQQTRTAEAEPVLRELAALAPDDEVERRLLVEGRELLTTLEADEG